MNLVPWWPSFDQPPFSSVSLKTECPQLGTMQGRARASGTIASSHLYLHLSSLWTTSHSLGGSRSLHLTRRKASWRRLDQRINEAL